MRGAAGSRGLWERLSAYLDGELSATDAAAFEQELERDTTLRAALDEMRRLSGRMTVEDSDLRAAQGIRAALRERLVRPRARAARTVPRWWWLPAVTVAAVAAFVAVRSVGPLAPAQPSVHVQAVAEQYALALDDLGRGQP